MLTRAWGSEVHDQGHLLSDDVFECLGADRKSLVCDCGFRSSLAWRASLLLFTAGYYLIAAMPPSFLIYNLRRHTYYHIIWPTRDLHLLFCLEPEIISVSSLGSCVQVIGTEARFVLRRLLLAIPSRPRVRMSMLGLWLYRK